MEVIVDELQKNGIRIDMTLLNIHVNRILCVYKTMYDEATSRLKADQLVDVFHENCFNTVARVMAYITLVRCMNLPKEEDVQGRRNEKRARGADFVEGHRQNFNYFKIHTLEFRGSVAFFLCQILTDHILKAVFQLRVFHTYVHARKTLNPFQYYI